MTKLLSLSAILALALAACTAAPTHTVAAPKAPEVQCLVCKHDADLACVYIPLTAETHHVQYAGQTYYFCSDECETRFLANPPKYIPRQTAAVH